MRGNIFDNADRGAWRGIPVDRLPYAVWHAQYTHLRAALDAERERVQAAKINAPAYVQPDEYDEYDDSPAVKDRPGAWVARRLGGWMGARSSLSCPVCGRRTRERDMVYTWTTGALALRASYRASWRASGRSAGVLAGVLPHWAGCRACWRGWGR